MAQPLGRRARVIRMGLEDLGTVRHLDQLGGHVACGAAVRDPPYAMECGLTYFGRTGGLDLGMHLAAPENSGEGFAVARQQWQAVQIDAAGDAAVSQGCQHRRYFVQDRLRIDHRCAGIEPDDADTDVLKAGHSLHLSISPTTASPACGIARATATLGALPQSTACG